MTPPDLATLCAHAGASDAPTIVQSRSHSLPIIQHSVFDFPTIESSLPALAGEGYVYRRIASPNADELAAAVARLEGAERGLATSSGMAAISAAVLSGVGAGDSIAVQKDAYGGTRAAMDADLSRLGVTSRYVDAYDLDRFASDIDGAKLVLVESVSNPLLREVDIAACARVCRDRGAELIVDNTFGTPLRRQPVSDGADLVLHSATKFLGGHHDLCAGVLAGRADRVAAAAGLCTRLGLACGPMDAWLAVRGVRTLHVRMERSWATAAILAERVATLDGVERVYSASRCALFSIDVGSFEAASRAVSRLEMIPLSPSLGGVVTTVAHPATSSHASLAPEQRAEAGIGDGLIRFSVGIEAVDDLWRDVAGALAGALAG